LKTAKAAPKHVLRNAMFIYASLQQKTVLNISTVNK
jgi:hypothetical protein